MRTRIWLYILFALFVVLLAWSVFRPAHYRPLPARVELCRPYNHLPDQGCTPGVAIEGVTTEQVCMPGYTRTVRQVSERMKRYIFRSYGVKSHKTGEYEIDHLIPLELGGANDTANLWPEAANPRPGFHEKDKVEGYLQRQVCSGHLPLQEAQREIAGDWLAVYQRACSAANC